MSLVYSLLPNKQASNTLLQFSPLQTAAVRKLVLGRTDCIALFTTVHKYKPVIFRCDISNNTWYSLAV